MTPETQAVVDKLLQIGMQMRCPVPGLLEFDIAGTKYIFNGDGTLKYTVEYQVNTDRFVEYYYNGKDKLKTSWNGETPPPDTSGMSVGP